MKIRNWKKDEGFTLIELLLVILIIAILAVIGISQFTNFAQDSRDAATKANLTILRNAIAKMNGIMRIRCNVRTTSFPPLVNLQNNSIIHGGSPCTAAQLSSVGAAASNDAVFVATGIPVNPWSNSTIDAINPPGTSATAPNAIHDCTDQPANVVYSTGAQIGWCYDQTTGKIWANSNQSSARTDVRENSF